MAVVAEPRLCAVLDESHRAERRENDGEDAHLDGDLEGAREALQEIGNRHPTRLPFARGGA
jgi:hypothetical protein